ncbi:tRNA (adenosine(37)-N6)-threonylcarbamoyltransferase complex ATPase subunit type 1 TsaE [Candidatus Saccharibacteria bacterium RIFCSPHIGHO2_12_FULL_49_19]|nr:MAG: tRNA (adenosine(37)-N6)-threonylcarbamoyltransferase complex ATPase subunit type 1 TsaE [Candidatus Saccharibacteria bacterium RIFCSPHIGHO2_01_FULL_49_21]OGL36664.1 MAG: tRNA (adenosine(37)-N6)-threonylcarbamoyltransferase complex ATPase subunit type 1 TsaE [Candidatus Saccharibacteria bacterium RIFCSPHIGHO2_12_FULL_49_19]OGL38432.1 MAG: tRNA (adenosine(37)-N6)-threonylcarbamoyltransferase complex ATPase subunit type 1 TsaE [Candidatus Saccharibacteria bacterium RIFCSPLOWO2_01_FULL_49_22]
MIWQTKSTSSAETERLGEALGRLLKAPAVLELKSDLGGGKTTFVRGLARGMGSTDIVASPTFTLSKIYKTKSGEIHHFDFYRLDEPGVVADQLSESLADLKAVSVIEWSKIVKDVLPADRITIEFKPVATNTDERQISFSYPDNLAAIVKKLETKWARVQP